MSELLRQYEARECGKDDYPFAWHRPQGPTYDDGSWAVPAIKELIREHAGHRCQRCGHPYRVGEVGERGEWSPCDEKCEHLGPVMWGINEAPGIVTTVSFDDPEPRHIGDVVLLGEMGGKPREHTIAWVRAQWRILTTHHLTGIKSDCRWGNLVALDQRCHLEIQGKVKMGQIFPFEHSEWFKPHAAWWYAVTYLSEENPSRESVMERLDDLLALERVL